MSDQNWNEAPRQWTKQYGNCVITFDLGVYAWSVTCYRSESGKAKTLKVAMRQADKAWVRCSKPDAST